MLRTVAFPMRCPRVGVRLVIGAWIAGLSLALSPVPVFAQGGPDGGRPTVDEDGKEKPETTDKTTPPIGTNEKEHPILKLVDEISDNMKLIEELLNQKNTGAECQDTQSRTLEKIDSLIEEMEKACSGSSSGSSSSKRQQKQNQKDQEQGKQQKQMAQKELQPQPTEPTSPEESPNNQTSEGKMPPGNVGSLQDRDGKGRWGRLPKRVVEQMYDNGNRKLPEKYRLLLEEYFGRLPQNDK